MATHKGLLLVQGQGHTVEVRIPQWVIDEARRTCDALDRGEMTLEFKPAKAKGQHPFAFQELASSGVQFRITKTRIR